MSALPALKPSPRPLPIDGRGPASERRLGRFQLLRELGRGAQARVWLAHDPRLDREVALKLLNPDADAQALSEWLNEARAVSRLTHPNIVPVFEADEHDAQPYLVFEYVDGPTLAQAQHSQPQYPAREAVSLMLGVLDALAAAHDQGIVHRDLKPSNILLGQDGRARVMDFGIAARISHSDGRIVGSPGYMSPEAARGDPPLPGMDVFAAGVMLGELLCGVPLMRETDTWRALQRVQTEDMELPVSVRMDDTLRGIVKRAMSRDVLTRYDSARALHAALTAWLTPEPTGADSSHATLDFLLRRMRHKTDFPALSSSVVRIQQVATSESESLARLTEEILKDVSLTNKLLRMVNTAHFSSVAGGGISTVSRAVALVGFAGIRNMALSVILLEHMGDKGHAALLKEEYLRSLMAGTLAADLTPQSRESEEAFLAAMFQNLGRLLTEYYFPEEALQIRQRLATTGVTPAAREAAARQVLGLGFDELGVGVARSWGLPDSLQRALRVPEGEVPARPIDPWADQGVERLRWLARGANAMADAMLAADGEAQTKALATVAERFAPALALQAKDMLQCALNARTRMAQMAQAMGLQVAPGAAARRLLSATPAGPLDGAPTVVLPSDRATAAPTSHRSQRSQTLETLETLETPEPAQSSPTSQSLGLQAGLEALQVAVQNPALRLNEVLSLVLETLQQALELRCVVFCLREPRTGHLVGRVALGTGAEDIRAAFRVPIEGAATTDLFAAVCTRGADLLISDSRTVAARLPAWYRQRVNAATFLLLPLLLKGAPIGLIYADKAVAGSLALDTQELALLRRLRDQAVAAFAKGSGAG